MIKKFIIILVFIFGCGNPEIKEIKVQYNDRSKLIEQVQVRTEKITNDSNTVLLKEEISLILEELKKLNSENKACQIKSHSQAREILQNKKDLKEAEWAIGFVSAFKYTIFGLIILGIVLLILKIKIPFMN
jgi:hypothetical protein